MVGSIKVNFIIIVCIVLTKHTICSGETDLNSNKDKIEELTAEETKKLEIIKRIKKINEDGSYTIGYEADDGSFKIESRDVLGQIKGTYGFIDTDGQIKKVSYSSTNSTQVINNKPEIPTTVVQRIPNNKKSSSTTIKPNYVNYSTVPPKVLLQNKFNSGGQISKPDTDISPTEVPVPIKNYKTVINQNKLRRELPEDGYNVREHIYNLQQSLGHDTVDVYSSSMTTGTPRPLFTTTANSRNFLPTSSSTTTAPTYSTSPSSTPRSTTLQYYRQKQQTPVKENIDEEVYTSSTTTTTTIRPEQQEPLVAIRQPNQRNPILVPLSQIQGRIVPIHQLQQQYYRSEEYIPQQPQYTHRKPVMIVEQGEEDEEEPITVHRRVPYPLQPMPVRVDQNGYLTELPRRVPTPYPLPVPVPVTTDVDSIQPPVSTKDFQRLLQQLILRQTVLEKISLMTRQPVVNYIQQQQQQQQRPYYLQQRDRNYIENEYDYSAYKPNKRLLRSNTQSIDNDEDYLPSDVRELLLLRMLQLAINPALPLRNEDLETVNESMIVKRTPVRNVKILGEDNSRESHQV